MKNNFAVEHLGACIHSTSFITTGTKKIKKKGRGGVRGNSVPSQTAVCMHIIFVCKCSFARQYFFFRLIHLAHNLFCCNEPRTEFCKSGLLRQTIEGGISSIFNS